MIDTDGQTLKMVKDCYQWHDSNATSGAVGGTIVGKSDLPLLNARARGELCKDVRAYRKDGSKAKINNHKNLDKYLATVNGNDSAGSRLGSEQGESSEDEDDGVAEGVAEEEGEEEGEGDD